MKPSSEVEYRKVKTSPVHHSEIDETTNETEFDNEMIECQEPTPTFTEMPRKIRSSIFVVLFCVFLDNMGISLTCAVLPYFGEQFGANSVAIGLLMTSYSLARAISALIMGKLSDRFGRRPLILYSLFGTCIGFLIIGFAQNITQLTIYQFVLGLSGLANPIAQAFITDVVSDKSQRDKYIAWTVAAEGIAFVAGPTIGGTAASILNNLRVPFFISSALGGIGLVFGYFTLIESHPNYIKCNHDTPDQCTCAPQHQPIPSLTLQNSTQEGIVDDLELQDFSENQADATVDDRSKVPMVIWILSIAYCMKQYAWAAYISMWALYMIHNYNFEVWQNGLMIAIYSGLYALTSIFYHKISKQIGEWYTCIFGCCLFLFMAGAVTTDEVWISLGSMFIAAGIGGSLVISAMPNIASNYTNELNRGYIIGMIDTSANIARVFGPIVHGFLFGVQSGLPFYAGAAAAFIAAIVLFMEQMRMVN